MALMDYMEASGLVARYGIHATRGAYVNSAEEAVGFAGKKAVALKVISEEAMHKTKSGMILLGLSGTEQITEGYQTLSEKAKRLGNYKMLVQEMAGSGIEIIIGGKIDQQFGKLILLGLGGIYVETFRDFATRVCPITERDARQMLYQLRSRAVIAPDEKTERVVTGLLMKASKLFYENDISELDLNPLIIYEGNYEAVDIRVLEDKK
ncbi:MAG: acetate--CoA ligase family protein [Candidatus Marsarchaeota archaeon]|nr:acetate--CoA ligase family protein [Candidatus Marsarchaeota archaeon]